MISKPSLNWGDDLERAETMLRAMCVGRAVMGVTAACEPDEVRRLLSELSTR